VKKGKLYRATDFFEAQRTKNSDRDGIVDVDIDTLFIVVSTHTCIRYDLLDRSMKYSGVGILTQDGILCYAWNKDLRERYEEL
jgi:hypothetical protein